MVEFTVFHVSKCLHFCNLEIIGDISQKNDNAVKKFMAVSRTKFLFLIQAMICKHLAKTIQNWHFLTTLNSNGDQVKLCSGSLMS